MVYALRLRSPFLLFSRKQDEAHPVFFKTVRCRTETSRTAPGYDLSREKNAMPRFYFHIRNGDFLMKDPEGSEVGSAEQAREEAVLAAREILAQRVLKGEPLVGDAFEIAAEDGHIVHVVPFTSVLVLS